MDFLIAVDDVPSVYAWHGRNATVNNKAVEFVKEMISEFMNCESITYVQPGYKRHRWKSNKITVTVIRRSECSRFYSTAQVCAKTCLYNILISDNPLMIKPFKENKLFNMYLNLNSIDKLTKIFSDAFSICEIDTGYTLPYQTMIFVEDLKTHEHLYGKFGRYICDPRVDFHVPEYSCFLVVDAVLLEQITKNKDTFDGQLPYDVAISRLQQVNMSNLYTLLAACFTSNIMDLHIARMAIDEKHMSERIKVLIKQIQENYSACDIVVCRDMETAEKICAKLTKEFTSYAKFVD